jgi:hypothetical protein
VVQVLKKGVWIAGDVSDLEVFFFFVELQHVRGVRKGREGVTY